ncbi:MAG: hypothetical protein ACR2PA_01915 [Hyphomicrobiaceae bacterium]
MDDYNFWQDLLDTYQSLPPWLQLAWLVLPPTFFLSLLALVLRFWLLCRRLGPIDTGRGPPVFTVTRNAQGAFEVYATDQTKTDPVRIARDERREWLE